MKITKIFIFLKSDDCPNCHVISCLIKFSISWISYSEIKAEKTSKTFDVQNNVAEVYVSTCFNYFKTFIFFNFLIQKNYQKVAVQSPEHL